MHHSFRIAVLPLLAFFVACNRNEPTSNPAGEKPTGKDSKPGVTERSPNNKGDLRDLKPGDQDKAGSPGNPPRILIASDIDQEGNLVLVNYQTVFAQPPSPKEPGAAFNTRILEKVPLKGVKIYDVTGKEVSVEAARKMIAKDTAVLASSWGRPLPPFYRKVFKDEMLLFAFPKEAPSWKEIQEPEHPVQ